MSDKFINQTGLSRLIENIKASFALKSHVHSADDITSGVLTDSCIPVLSAGKIQYGTISSSRLPAATTTSQGAMSAADKVKLDGIDVMTDAEVLAILNTASS